MNFNNSLGTPLVAAGVVLAALGFIVALGIIFKGNVHF